MIGNLSKSRFRGFLAPLAVLVAVCTPHLVLNSAPAAEIFVETESFDDPGGWKLDTQFIQQMGSPYLLAHGLGTPVDDAVTQIDVKQPGTYRVWARTFDWVARWDAPGHPGKFQIQIGDQTLDETFGTEGATWGWQDGGTIQLSQGKTELRLKDLTGFDGRCDCLYLTTQLDSDPPPPADKVLSDWRRKQLGLPDEPLQRGPYDLVVVGGGYAGMGSAISAARMGCRVALIQDRGVLGGNGSSEVRVWAMGNIRRGKFPRIGEIIEEFADQATKSPGRYEEFGDDLKERVVRAEPQIDLWLNHHAFDAVVQDNHIVSVDALNTKTGEVVRMLGDRFVDCTGHGWLGQFVGADSDMAPDGRMGMSNMWRWDETDSPKSFPETPWALDLEMQDFPYPRDHHGQWFWESGFDKDAIGDAEGIRDWNLRAVYGAFNAMKNRDGAADHKTAVLSWVAYVGGPRESNRLLGDVVLTQDDIVAKRDFPDGCVPSTWSIDLHYPKEQYAKKYPDNPFISVAVHDRRVDRSYGYPVPYRCFYSRNIDNLFMAGRNVSVTHEALGTVRVMKTCGMMGEVVGKAASICALRDCTPRDVYQNHLDELLELLELPGKARRSTPSAPITIDEGALPRASKFGPMTGQDPASFEGIVIDDREAELKGKWTSGGGRNDRYVAYSYKYAGPGSGAQATYTLKAPRSGRFQILVGCSPADDRFNNRATDAPVEIRIGDQVVTESVNYQGTEDRQFTPVATIDVEKDEEIKVVILTEQANGLVHLDAVQMIPAK
ncbi:FAD-dependent oxidoreductase [Stieleria magnilauensis]|uniref:tRNA uridine 5-carboxymethylaminomethyl modification enzyme MnmG n=1 Tax=Stieleria magnilauensis TaxID=2527963 RepID=A0ABX5Y6Q8_9BACT|nr:tRNA uridine 5-carboxymethylaminomethyl modification enzyme MnmG [Planctomycetes bacterium TBK1r]